MSGDNYEREPKPDNAAGRWPANLILTHAANCGDNCATDCLVNELDRQSGITKDGVAVQRNGGGQAIWGAENRVGNRADVGYGASGGASRFFTVTEWDPIADVAPFRYVPKPSRAERNAGLADLPLVKGGTYEGNKDNGIPNKIGASPDVPVAPAQNHHPTVKPLALMRWLVRLVTPPGGTVLEPFAGSGTTMAAAIMEDRHVIGCELTADYLPIIEGRIAWAHTERNNTPDTLFDPTE